MTAMLSAFVAIAVITVGAWYGLTEWDYAPYDRSPGSVRLDDAGVPEVEE